MPNNGIISRKCYNFIDYTSRMGLNHNVNNRVSADCQFHSGINNSSYFILLIDKAFHKDGLNSYDNSKLSTICIRSSSPRKRKELKNKLNPSMFKNGMLRYAPLKAMISYFFKKNGHSQ